MQGSGILQEVGFTTSADIPFLSVLQFTMPAQNNYKVDYDGLTNARYDVKTQRMSSYVNAGSDEYQ